MKFRTGFIVVSVLAICFTAKGSQTLISQDELVLTAIQPQIWEFVSKSLISEKKDGYKELLSTLIMVDESKPLSEESLKGLLKLANSSENGFKELFASEILVEGGYDLSERALERALGMANGRISAILLNDEKRLLAVRVLQTYGKAILKKRKQTQ